MHTSASTQTTSTRPLVKTGIVIVLAALAIFFAWSALAPLDEGIPVPGVVAIDTKRKTIQHLSGGVVSKVYVKEGQVVAKGALLLEIDAGQARSDYLQARHRYLGLRATESRLLAKKAGREQIAFHPDLLAESADPAVHAHLVIQKQLHHNDLQSLNSDLAALDESIRSQGDSAAGLQAQLVSRKEQLGLLTEQLVGLHKLTEEGYAPRNQLLEMERQRTELQAVTAQLIASLHQTRAAISELNLRKQQKRQESQRDVDVQLAQIQQEILADKSKLDSSTIQLSRTRITSPVAGAVVGLVNQTIGGVIPAGARIMDIVPADEQLLFEANVPPQHANQVKTGQLALVRFTSFTDQPQLTLAGRVLSTSADQLINSATNQPYFLTRIQITPEGMKQLGHRRLLAGMPAEVLIRTGERTLLAYLMEPLLKRMNQAMKEQ
ncbi:HlyD family type I secretion periplasmic adaptor subunit [Vogesella indigofera]|uniref:HlyD family type I secretion periplasmic adaptor subunit n=1 Tax=Vogesella indigofera TaxID=45465 RepID=UPI00234F9545|nr:HlyD family type I secretion periplasmic adaptor subunit [Vogesella indigofera]MDC7709697.1 HlyD family type I secretion periplasmic adaptor subunit [Vogesella indigofera]